MPCCQTCRRRVLPKNCGTYAAHVECVQAGLSCMVMPFNTFTEPLTSQMHHMSDNTFYFFAMQLREDGAA